MASDAKTDLRTIALVGFPLDLFARARQHNEALLREFAFLVDGGGDNTDIPRQLLDVVGRVRVRAAGLNAGALAMVETAMARGDETGDFEFVIPVSIAASTREFASLLDQVDAYCAAGDLLTLAAPPELRRFRDWYLGEITGQVEGRPPIAWCDYTGETG
jgi:hypothetical protein